METVGNELTSVIHERGYQGEPMAYYAKVNRSLISIGDEYAPESPGRLSVLQV